MKPPILLFGLPRSGTTWAGKILDSHPQTLYRHEPDSVRRLSIPLFPDSDDAVPAWASEIRAMVAEMPHMRESKVVGKTPLFPKDYLSTPTFALKRAGIFGAKAIARLNRGFPVPYLPRAERRGSGRIVWKSIESLGRLGVVLDALDDALAIHLIRHPCGYISSVIRGEAAHNFVDNRPSSDDYELLEMLLVTAPARKHGLSMEALRTMTPEERLAWRWLLVNEKALEDTAPGGRVHVVSYDALCRDPGKISRDMFRFVDLDWNEQTENFIARSTASEDAGYYSVFKSPSHAAMRWRDELSPESVGRIMNVVEKSPLGKLFPAHDATG